MKVLFFIDSLRSGGKERRLVELLKGLDEEDGIKCEIVIMNRDVHYEQIFNLSTVIHYIIRKSKKDFSVFSQVKKVIKDFRPDIIHCWDSMTAVYALPASKRYGIKFVNSMVSSMPVKRNILNKYWLRARITFPFSDLIIGNSKAGLQGYRAPQSRSLCIYNGLDFKRFTDLGDPIKYREEILGNSEANQIVVGMVAAFDPRKDYRTLIETALGMVKKNDQYRFILVGDGTEFSSMREMVPKELQKRIIFLGRRSDVESIVNIFDIGVLLTNSEVHGEGISNSIIEYMALSKPVIATRGGGTDEVVMHEENGYRIDFKDNKVLADKIQKLAENPELRHDMGKKGRELTETKFNLTKMTQDYIKAYRRVLGSN